MPDKELGIYFNQKMLTMILGVVTLGTAMVGGVTYFSNQARDIAELRQNQQVWNSQLADQIEKLNANTTERLSKVEASVNDMALAVRELEVRQQTQQSAQVFSYPQVGK